MILIVASFSLSVNAHAERIALVIGNAQYENADDLPQTRNDAIAMAAKLDALGFTLVGGQAHIDQTRAEILHHLRDFGSTAKPGDQAVFYFSGHGIGGTQTNYLLPSNDKNIKVREDVDDFAIDVSSILSRLPRTGQGVNILILDACRNNPLPSAAKSAFAEKGLGRVSGNTANTVFLYAAEPGEQAYVSPNGQSYFTSALLSALDAPGQDLDDLIRTVRSNVVRETTNRTPPQRPWFEGVANQPFYFNRAGEFFCNGLYDGAAAEARWRAVQARRDPTELQTFSETCSDTPYAEAASSLASALTPERIESSLALESAPPTSLQIEPQGDRSRPKRYIQSTSTYLQLAPELLRGNNTEETDGKLKYAQRTMEPVGIGGAACLAQVLIPETTEVITEQVLDKPERTETIVLPAKFEIINGENVLIEPEATQTIILPPTFKTVEKVIVTGGGGLDLWRVICEGPGSDILVNELITALRSAGYSPGFGFDDSTAQAMAAYQRDRGLPVGLLTLATLEDLNIPELDEIKSEFERLHILHNQRVYFDTKSIKPFPISAEVGQCYLSLVQTQNSLPSDHIAVASVGDEKCRVEVPAQYDTVIGSVLVAPSTYEEQPQRVLVRPAYTTWAPLTKLFGETDIYIHPRSGALQGGLLSIEVFGNRNLPYDKIQALQTALSSRGFPVASTGLFDPDTLEAVVAFQTKENLNVIGVLTPETMQELDVQL